MSVLRATSGFQNAFADQLREFPFVRNLSYEASKNRDQRYDGLLTIVDKKKRRFSYLVQMKSSYLDRASTNAAIAHARLAQKATGRPTLLLARYVPAPTGERLIQAGINFLDLSGNTHLDLGADHSRTMLGRPEVRRPREHRPITAAELQILFLFATNPAAPSLAVREIATLAGVSKSKAAQVRQELMETGLLSEQDKLFRPTKEIEASLLSGYAQVLRPKVIIGRFQSLKPPEAFLSELPTALRETDVRFALTGGPGADLLNHYYRGAEIPLFVTASGPELHRLLRILPDRQGPIILLRAFGEVVFWREISGVTVAPPWLVYAELMNSTDPRAHEAAEELRGKYFH